MSEALFVYHREGIAFEDTLQAFAQLTDRRRAVALLYSARQCRWAEFTNGSLLDEEGTSIATNEVFEARVFDPVAELRWWNDPGQARCHRAVILAGSDMSDKLGGWNRSVSPNVIATLEQTYLLWGSGTPDGGRRNRALREGWSELATARIGRLPVPIADVGHKQTVVLKTKEYVVEGEHGNAVIFEERLMQLELEREVSDG